MSELLTHWVSIHPVYCVPSKTWLLLIGGLSFHKESTSVMVGSGGSQGRAYISLTFSDRSWGAASSTFSSRISVPISKTMTLYETVLRSRPTARFTFRILHWRILCYPQGLISWGWAGGRKTVETGHSPNCSLIYGWIEMAFLKRQTFLLVPQRH